jgi:hypothetical protein
LKLSGGDADKAKEIVDRSRGMGWQGLFELPKTTTVSNTNGTGGNSNQTFRTGYAPDPRFDKYFRGATQDDF